MLQIKNLDTENEIIVNMTRLGPDETIALESDQISSWGQAEDVIQAIMDENIQVILQGTPIESKVAQIDTLKGIRVSLTAEKDLDEALIIRPKAAAKGWSYFLCPMELKTSSFEYFFKDHLGEDESGITVKLFDSEGDEITDPLYANQAVKTVLDFEPPYDYEVIGGQVQQHTQPTENIRVWVVGAPDIPKAWGGSKEFIGGLNLKFIAPSDYIEADGRVSKFMKYNAELHTSKLRFIVEHPVGQEHEILLSLELFRA
jgi:hypothetical protein